MSVRLVVKLKKSESEFTDYSQYVQLDSFEMRTGWSYGDKTHVNSISIKATGTEIQMRAMAEAYEAQVMKDGTIIFEGLVSDDYTITYVTDTICDLELTFDDYSSLLKDAKFPSSGDDQSPWREEYWDTDSIKVCDPSDTGNSLIHKIFAYLSAPAKALGYKFVLDCGGYSDASIAKYVAFEDGDKVMDAWVDVLTQNGLAYWVDGHTVRIVDVVATGGGTSATGTTVRDIQTDAKLTGKAYLDDHPTPVSFPEVRKANNGAECKIASKSHDGSRFWHYGSRDIAKEWVDLSYDLAGETNKAIDKKFVGPFRWDVDSDLYYVKTSDSFVQPEEARAYCVLRKTSTSAFRNKWKFWLYGYVRYVCWSTTVTSDDTQGDAEQCDWIWDTDHAKRYLSAQEMAISMGTASYEFYADEDLNIGDFVTIRNLAVGTLVITGKVDRLDPFGGYTYTAIPYAGSLTITFSESTTDVDTTEQSYSDDSLAVSTSVQAISQDVASGKASVSDTLRIWIDKDVAGVTSAPFVYIGSSTTAYTTTRYVAGETDDPEHDGEYYVDVPYSAFDGLSSPVTIKATCGGVVGTTTITLNRDTYVVQYAVLDEGVTPDNTTSWSTTVPSSIADSQCLWCKDLTGKMWRTSALDGQNGWSNATCQLFKRSATTPSAYDGSQLTYTFATATLTGDTGSWSRTIPSGDYPLYVIYASAFAAADTDIVETTDWTEPAILSENGTKGESGLSVKTILLYQRSEAAPALPTGQVTYNFDSGEISGQGAWSLDVPTTNGYPLWVTSATAASRSASDIIEPSEWSTPVIMAQDGAKGDKGDTGPQGAKGDTGPKGATGATGAQGPQGEKGDTGAQGPQGIQGKTGNGINSVTVTYGVSASASTKPSTWSTDIPSVTAGQYLWTRTITDYTDDSVADTVTYTYALQGKTGATGPKGETGSTGASGTSVTVSSIQYQAGTSATTAPTGTWSSNPVSVAQGRYLWTKTTFSDGKVAYGVARQGTDGNPGATGATGEQGPQGEQGVSVTGIVEEYALSTSNTSVTGTWGTAVPTLTATNKYLWNRSKTTYSDGTSSGYTTALIIGVYGDKGETGATGPQGEKGETGAQGPTGATGATGRGISGITEYYLASASSTAPSSSDTGWSTTPQTPTTAKPYLWNKTVVTYTSGSSTSTIAMIGQSIKGNPGATGATGNGIKSVTVTYGVSASPSTQPTSWSNTIPTVSEGQYLWTRTITDYTDDSVADTVTYTYAKQGKTGGTGATGNGIRSVTNHYLATNASNGVTTSTSGWSTSVQTMTEANRYLWNYETIAYTNGTSVNSTPCVIGVYGSKGNTGSPGTSVTVSSIQYQAGTSATTAPTGTWSNNPVSVAQGHFLWTKTTFSDGNVAYGVARQGTDGKPGGTGATGRGIKSIAHYYATTSTQSAPSASSITSTTIPTMSASKKYLWHKTIITYTDTTTSSSVELIAIYGDTGDSASIKDFDLDLSAKSFSVNPRGYTRTSETIVATCTLIHVAVSAVTITWSSTSSQVTLTPSSDKTTCTISVAARVALLPFRVSCAVTGVGLTKTVSIDVQPESGNAYSPIYLGTNWDTTKNWSNNNDPIWSGDYYLDTSTNTPMIATVSSSGTITYSAMQTGNPNTALIMGTVLSDILAQGSGVQSTCVAVNAYFGAIAAKTGFIESLRSQVIQSANYSEDSSGNPVTGYKLDGPNNVIKAASMKAVGGMYRGISIEDGSMEITDGDTSIFKTVSGDNENVVSISANGLLKYYNINSYLDTSNVAENTENSTNCMFKGKTYQRYCRSTKTHNVQLLNYTNPYSPQGQNVYGQNIPIPDITYTVTIDNHCDSVSIICEQFYAYKRLKSDGSYEQTIRIVKELKCRIGNTVTVLKSSGDIYGDNTFSRTLTDVPAGAVITCTYSSQYYKYVVAGSDNQKYALEMPQDTFIVTGMAVHEEGYLYLLNFDYSVGAKIPLGKWYLATENQLVIGSHSSSATHTLCKDFLELLELYRSASVDAKYNSYYNDGTVSLTGLKTVLISSIDFTVKTTEGNYGYNANEYIKGVPQLEYHPVYELKGITALNLNASTGISQIGTDTKPFASTWTQNINNVPVTDSNNQSLAVSGASSIVGALNQINRDLHVRLPIYHGSLMPNGNLAYICDTPTMTTSELQRYRYLCISGYMDSGALIQPETHRFPLYDTNGSITALGQMFTGSTTFLQTIVTGINYGANGDENAFLGGWVLQFNTAGNTGKMTCSQYKRCIITTKQIQAYYQYKVTDIWLE